MEHQRQRIGLFLGPALFALLLLTPLPHGLPPAGLKVAAVAVLMAVWWISEALPIAATALLPIALFPLLGVTPTAKVTPAYANHLIYLFLGGFLIAMAMQKWNLHRRIALHIIRRVGTSPHRMVLGFMVATAFLSMWISNTATTMMMLPIALAVIAQLHSLHGMDTDAADEQADEFATGLMLGIAYAASIGGVATLIGTPPNAILAGIAEKLYGLKIGFADWLLFGLPLSIVMLAITWVYLTRIAAPGKLQTLEGADELMETELQRLGPITRPEIQVATILATVSVLWIARGLVDLPGMAIASDASIAMAGALLLFLIPVNFDRGEFLLDWQTAVKIPWDIIILFGGGFALAQGFSDSGLSNWIIGQLSLLHNLPGWVVVVSLTLLVIFLTEITSNTATTSLVIPLMGALASAMGMGVLELMVPAAVAASYAFMLPVATPPNAIVFSSRHITMPQMARAGLWLNLIATAVISVFVLWLLPGQWQ